MLDALDKVAPVNINGTEILVVDDDQDVVDLLCDVLAGQNYIVHTAANGNDALQALDSNAGIAAVLLDVRIPGKGGMEVLKDIRKRRPGIGVVMVSGIQDREIAQHAITLGAFDYLIKPFDINHLTGIVGACLSQKEYQKQSWWKRLTS